MKVKRPVIHAHKTVLHVLLEEDVLTVNHQWSMKMELVLRNVHQENTQSMVHAMTVLLVAMNALE